MNLVAQYKRLLSDLLARRALGPVSGEEEVAMAEQRHDIWLQLSTGQRVGLERWIEQQMERPREDALARWRSVLTRALKVCDEAHAEIVRLEQENATLRTALRVGRVKKPNNAARRKRLRVTGSR